MPFFTGDMHAFNKTLRMNMMPGHKSKTIGQQENKV